MTEFKMICCWCSQDVRALTRVIINATQEESAACDRCLRLYGDDATGELNSVRDPLFERVLARLAGHSVDDGVDAERVESEEKD